VFEHGIKIHRCSPVLSRFWGRCSRPSGLRAHAGWRRRIVRHHLPRQALYHALRLGMAIPATAVCQRVSRSSLLRLVGFL
jgi:hypothetical protein